jgi:hypothetical protein
MGVWAARETIYDSAAVTEFVAAGNGPLNAWLQWRDVSEYFCPLGT